MNLVKTMRDQGTDKASKYYIKFMLTDWHLEEEMLKSFSEPIKRKIIL